MPDSLALRAQAERVRAMDELCGRGHSPLAAWALLRWRQERRQARTAGRQQAVRPDPSRWAMCGAAAIVAGFVGIAAGFFWLVVTHGPKIIERLRYE